MDSFKYLSKGFDQAPSNEGFNTLVFFLIIIAIIIFIIVFNYLKKKYNLVIFKKYNVKKSTFNSLANSVGLNNDETKLLFNLVVRQNLKFPLNCFTSSKVLDDVLIKELHELESDSSINQKDRDEKTYLIFNIKSKIDENLKKNIGLKSTHLISENQKIVIFIRNLGYYYGNVIKNNKNFLVVELISDKVLKRILTLNEFVKMYLWREEDAGYTFETEVVGLGENVRTYHFKHTEKLSRTQKRKFRRIPVRLTGELFLINLEKDNTKKIYRTDPVPNNIDIMNLSSGGLRIHIKDINRDQKFVKIVLKLNKNSINVVGKIVRFYQKEDFKDLTIQFVKISLNDINIVNQFVYKYYPEHN